MARATAHVVLHGQYSSHGKLVLICIVFSFKNSNAVPSKKNNIHFGGGPLLEYLCDAITDCSATGALSYKVVYKPKHELGTCSPASVARDVGTLFSCLMRPDESEYSKRFPDHRSHENESQEPETGDNSWMDTDGDVVA